MFSFTQFLIIAAAVTFVCGASFKTTTPLQEYYLLSQRELLHEIDLVNTEIDGVDGRILDRLAVLSYQQDQVLNEINQVNKTYFPLQALSVSRKYCIQKYDPQLITYDIAAKDLLVCYKKASSNPELYTSSAKTKTSIAVSYATTNLYNSVVNCDKRYTSVNDLPALENCYISAVAQVTTYVDSQLASAKEYLKKGLYDSTIAYQAAISCSFEVEKEVLDNIGQTSSIIEKCETCVGTSNTAPSDKC